MNNISMINFDFDAFQDKNDHTQGSTRFSTSFFDDEDSKFDIEKAFQRDFQKPELQDVFQCQVQEDQNLLPNEELIEEEELDYQNQIFKEANIKKLTIKNNNLPKFLIRVFMKESYQFAKKNQLIDFNADKVQEIQEELMSRNGNVWMTKDLVTLFGPDEQKKNFRHINRMIMNKTLRQKLKDEVIKNSKVKRSKLSALIASKVYSLRLRSKILACRVQSR